MIGDQLESEARLDGQIGPIITPRTSLRQALGFLGRGGGRLFFTEGLWSFDGALSLDMPDVHFYSTSPGRTVFKRASTSSSRDSLLTLSKDGAIIDGIRFIDSVADAGAVISCTSTRATIKNCVFEDVQKGVIITGSWCSVRDCSFLTSQGYAVEFSGSASNGIVAGNIIQDAGGSVYLGDSVSEVSVINNVFENTSGGSVKISYFADKEIVTGSALNVVHADQVQERR
jgi:hypothetical protein